MSHIVYILYSKSSDKYYVGETSNLQTRILFHNELAINSYTSRYRPWIIFAFISVSNRSIARKIEDYLKKKPRSFLHRFRRDEDLRNWIIKKYEDN